MATVPGKKAPQQRPVVSPPWQAVAQGLTWLSVGAILTFTGLLLLALLTLAFMAASDHSSKTALGIAGLGSLIVIFLGNFLLLIGQCLCCTVPAETGTRPLAIGAVACWIISVFLISQTVASPLAPSISVPDQRFRPPGIQSGTSATQQMQAFTKEYGALTSAQLLMFVSSILLISFLYGVAAFFRNELLVRDINFYLIYQAGAMVVGYVMGVVLGVITSTWQSSIMLWVLVTFLLVGVLILVGISWFWFLSLLKRTRTTIRKAQPKNWPAEGPSIA